MRHRSILLSSAQRGIRFTATRDIACLRPFQEVAVRSYDSLARPRPKLTPIHSAFLPHLSTSIFLPTPWLLCASVATRGINLHPRSPTQSILLFSRCRTTPTSLAVTYAPRCAKKYSPTKPIFHRSPSYCPRTSPPCSTIMPSMHSAFPPRQCH